MNPQATPPPWTARRLQPNGPDHSGDPAWVLDGPPQPLGPGSFAKEADARLASSSPELYDATEALITLCESLAETPLDPASAATLDHARAALAKANGRLPSPPQEPLPTSQPS